MFSLRIAKPRILLRITKRRRKLIMGSNQKGDPVCIIGVKESQPFGLHPCAETRYFSDKAASIIGLGLRDRARSASNSAGGLYPSAE